MNDKIATILKSYPCSTKEDYDNALKEILQNLALLGLWRSKFFEKAAFYGGTSLRILHGLNRFSEDLDFILLKPQSDFSMTQYLEAIRLELLSFGLEVNIHTKEKNKKSAIQSAFLKAKTQEHIIKIGAPKSISSYYQQQEVSKIKIEVDINPALEFNTELKTLFFFSPFFVRSLDLSSLFSGKLHAILCREWKTRVKGRDWFDWLWFTQNKCVPNYPFLENKLRQSKHYLQKNSLNPSILLTLLLKRIEVLDIEQAKKDIARFISSPNFLDSWSKELFEACAHEITR